MGASLLTLSLMLAAGGDPCDIPASYTHVITSQPAGLEFTLATDKSVYLQGQTAQFYFRVENRGSDTWSVVGTECPENCFAVYPDGCTALDQAGCYDDYVFFYPEVVDFFPCGLSVAPGECKVFTKTWDLTTVDWNLDQLVPAPPGHYRLLAGVWTLDGDWPGAFVADSGLALDIEIQAQPTAVHTSTWGAVKALYR